MHIKYLVFSMILFCCFFYKSETLNKDNLINQEIEVEVINNDTVQTYKTTLGITIKDFLEQNNLEGNCLLNYNYTLFDNDVINISKENKKSINNISLKELKDLPYISDNNAEAIIEYRNKNGNFKSFDDVKRVKGIGESKLKILKEYLTL